MRIGIIGTGLMGQALGTAWARAGHEVLFGSRDSQKAERAAASAGPMARAGDFDRAAEHGDVVLYTARDRLPSELLRLTEALAGKVVIDCNNRDLGDDSRPAEFRASWPPPELSIAERIARDCPNAKIVKAFNTLPNVVLQRSASILAPHRVSVFLCGDDQQAKETVKALAETLGLVGIDCGGLERARLVEAAADFLRILIGPQGLGLMTTLSVHVLPDA